MLYMGALRYKKTKTDQSAWNSSSAIPNAESHADAYAYLDEESNSYKFVHHALNSDGSVGPANIAACKAAITLLNSGKYGFDLENEDACAVYNHLAAHLRDAGVEDIPQLNSAEIQ